MPSTMAPERLEAAYQTALTALLAERTPEGYWVGELSSSALATATAVSALALVQKHAPAENSHDVLIDKGIRWLVDHQNADGGWGDTVKSFSNISTTMLCRAAFHLSGTASRFALALSRAEDWLTAKYGNTPEQLAEAVRARYGKDRTFAVPILTTCALAGLVSWREVPPLPFELACLPQSWFRFLRLPVVSYALPALIAIGQAVYHHRPPRNPIMRLARRFALGRSLRVLKRIQPSNGGFLEATPLTSFVTLSLAVIGHASHSVVRKSAQFLVNSARADGSWPIDTNLSTWVTTLAVNALAAAGLDSDSDEVGSVPKWLLQQQFKERHSYTGAAPGGWGWTPMPGSVPDEDDTAGALLALHNITPLEIPIAGLHWLLNLQNSNGGWPTFCRGWGTLPFDRSGADLSAHALRAFNRWRIMVEQLASQENKYIGITSIVKRPFLTHKAMESAVTRGFAYLSSTQRPDGSWLPLWFGNQHVPNDENATYGTARVLAAYRDLDMMDTEPAQRGVAWLLANQNPDGGWGGCLGTPSSTEETALAVETLLDPPGLDPEADSPCPVPDAVNKGLTWLVDQVEAGTWREPAPIGFYFAKLWYFEKLYPLIFTVAALGRARRKALMNHGTECDS